MLSDNIARHFKISVDKQYAKGYGPKRMRCQRFDFFVEPTLKLSTIQGKSSLYIDELRMWLQPTPSGIKNLEKYRLPNSDILDPQKITCRVEFGEPNHPQLRRLIISDSTTSRNTPIAVIPMSNGSTKELLNLPDTSPLHNGGVLLLSVHGFDTVLSYTGNSFGIATVLFPDLKSAQSFKFPWDHVEV